MADLRNLSKQRSYLFDAKNILPFVRDLSRLVFVDFFVSKRRPHVIDFARAARGHAFEAATKFPTITIGDFVHELSQETVSTVEIPGPDAIAKAGLGGPWPYFLLGSIAKALKPKRIFEIGTFRGVSTLTFALNTSDDCEIVTLDLPQESTANDTATLSAGDREWVALARDSAGIAFRGTSQAARIRQVFANSMTFDAAAEVGQVDLCFVDGGHSYDCIRIDTENALRIVKPGGLIIWDDYAWFMDSVCRYLDELSAKMPLRRIANSQLVVYRRPR